MKKLSALGRSLSKTEQKKIMGGYDDDGGCPLICVSDSDCGRINMTCPDGTVHYNVQGRCNINNCCRFSTVCV